MSADDGTCNRDYFIEQYPDLADVFRPKTKAMQSFAQPNPPRKPKAAVVPVALRAPERAGDVVVLNLPLPPAELQPNRKGNLHHYKRAKLVKATRNAAAMYMHIAMQGEPGWPRVTIDVKLWTARRLDRGNVIGWLKATEDGISDAMKVNDQGFEFREIEQFPGKLSEGKREMVLTITRLT